MKTANIIIGAILGSTIWAVSPALFGHREPWDLLGPYLGLLSLSGIVSALPNPRNWWSGAIGIYVGQFAFVFAVLSPGNLWPISMIIGAILALSAALGGLVTFGLWAFLKKASEARNTRRNEQPPE